MNFVKAGSSAGLSSNIFPNASIFTHGTRVYGSCVFHGKQTITTQLLMSTIHLSRVVLHVDFGAISTNLDISTNLYIIYETGRNESKTNLLHVLCGLSVCEYISFKICKHFQY